MPASSTARLRSSHLLKAISVRLAPRRALRFHPFGAPARSVRRVGSLRYNALQPKLARVFQDHGAVALQVLDVFHELNAGGVVEQCLQHALAVD